METNDEETPTVSVHSAKHDACQHWIEVTLIVLSREGLRYSSVTVPAHLYITAKIRIPRLSKSETESVKFNER